MASIHPTQAPWLVVSSGSVSPYEPQLVDSMSFKYLKFLSVITKRKFYFDHVVLKSQMRVFKEIGEKTSMPEHKVT